MPNQMQASLESKEYYVTFPSPFIDLYRTETRGRSESNTMQ